MLHGVSVSILTNDEGSSKKSSSEIDKLTFLYIFFVHRSFSVVPKTLQYKYVYIFVAIASGIGNANGFAVNPSFQEVEGEHKKSEHVKKFPI